MSLILDLCGGTGSWSQPYVEAGYEVLVVTQPAMDVRAFDVPDGVQGVLAAPPCTELAGSGARWWADKPPELLAEALEVVDACLGIIEACRPAWWALENPIGRLRRLRRDRLGEPRLIFDPCDYGDPWRKRTLLWGEFTLPETDPVLGFGWWGFRELGGKSERTKRLRSVTPPGFARAFFDANP